MPPPAFSRFCRHAAWMSSARVGPPGPQNIHRLRDGLLLPGQRGRKRVADRRSQRIQLVQQAAVRSCGVSRIPSGRDAATSPTAAGFLARRAGVRLPVNDLGRILRPVLRRRFPRGLDRRAIEPGDGVEDLQSGRHEPQGARHVAKRRVVLVGLQHGSQSGLRRGYPAVAGERRLGRSCNFTSGNLACAGAVRSLPGHAPAGSAAHPDIPWSCEPTMEKREWTDGRIRRSRPSWNI